MRIVFCLFISVVLYSGQSLARPLAQILFEEQTKTLCQDASPAENERLRKCLQHDSSGLSLSGPTAEGLSLDQTSEYLVFNEVANSEAERLSCLYSQLNDLKTNVELKEAAIAESCSKLSQLRDTLNNKRFLESWIKSYRTTNDRTIRKISDSEFEKNLRVISSLEQRLSAYQLIEDTIQLTDSLLSSPTIYQAIKGRLEDGILLSGDSDSRACSFLKKNLDRFLEQDISSTANSRSHIKHKLTNTQAWIEDEDFKRDLWQSSSRLDLLHPLMDTPDFRRSTYCRLEGRYGHGARMRDSIYNVSLFALGGAAGSFLRTLALTSRVQRSVSALTSARAVVGAETLTSLGLSAPQIIAACSSRMEFSSGLNNCSKLGEEERKQLFFRQINANRCIQNASFATAANMLGTAGITKATQSLADEIANAALTSQLASRSTTTQGILQRDLAVKAPAAVPAQASREGLTALSAKEVTGPTVLSEASMAASRLEKNLTELGTAQSEMADFYRSLRSRVMSDSSLNESVRKDLLAQIAKNENAASREIDRLLLQSETAESLSSEINQLRALQDEQQRALARKIELGRTSTNSAPVTITAAPTMPEIHALRPDQNFAIPLRTGETIQTTFSSDVVQYLQKTGGDNPRRFMSAMKNGFVSAHEMAGLKWIDASKHLVEVKIMGSGAQLRIVGCFKAGQLQLLRIVDKKNERLPLDRISSLCR